MHPAQMVCRRPWKSLVFAHRLVCAHGARLKGSTCVWASACLPESLDPQTPFTVPSYLLLSPTRGLRLSFWKSRCPAFLCSSLWFILQDPAQVTSFMKPVRISPATPLPNRMNQSSEFSEPFVQLLSEAFNIISWLKLWLSP